MPNLSNSKGFAYTLAANGHRLTRQREGVYKVLVESRDHPTAEEVFQRAKERMPNVSFATVYNCLGVLAQCGLVRQVILDRTPKRFCSNMKDHLHFFCENCGQVIDIEVTAFRGLEDVKLPEGFQVTHCETSLKGLCSQCSRK